MFTRIELFTCKYVLDAVKHCGDYGLFYVHKTDRVICMVLGDGDEVDTDEVLEKLPKDTELIVEAECCPEDPKKWLLISRGIECAEGFEYDQEDNLIGVTKEINPKLLSVEEHYEYYKFFKKLKV
jgi:hypothetical protein